jgi:transcriptional regulator with XRE-family HTH domain
MTASQMVTRHAEWVAKNPLRIWRKAEGVSPTALASYLGVTSLTVYQWERGGNQPNEENLAKLAIAMNARDLGEVWKEWLSERPAA